MPRSDHKKYQPDFDKIFATNVNFQRRAQILMSGMTNRDCIVTIKKQQCGIWDILPKSLACQNVFAFPHPSPKTCSFTFPVAMIDSFFFLSSSMTTHKDATRFKRLAVSISRPRHGKNLTLWLLNLAWWSSWKAERSCSQILTLLNPCTFLTPNTSKWYSAAGSQTNKAVSLSTTMIK